MAGYIALFHCRRESLKLEGRIVLHMAPPVSCIAKPSRVFLGIPRKLVVGRIEAVQVYMANSAYDLLIRLYSDLTGLLVAQLRTVRLFGCTLEGKQPAVQPYFHCFTLPRYLHFTNSPRHLHQVTCLSRAISSNSTFLFTQCN